MNGVLSTLTWGTWDEAAWCSAAADSAHPAAANAARDATAPASAKSQRKLQRKGLRAPAQSQLWFDEVLTRATDPDGGFGRSCYQCNPLHCVHDSREMASEASVIPWAKLPAGIHPRDGKLPPLRASNKRLQVENLAVFLQRMLRYVRVLVGEDAIVSE